MRNIFLMLFALCCTVMAHAQKAEADSAYADGNYEKAIALYDSLMRQEGSSAEACYNMGCCYYRLDDAAHAVLYFERALLLEPGDDDIRTNLEMARSKTIDKITPHHEIFFITWWHRFVNLMGVDSWATMALWAFIAMLVLTAVYLFAPRLWMKKAGFYSAVASLMLCILANMSAWQGKQKLDIRQGAVVMSSSAVVRSTPAKSGVDLFVIHEGTRIDIIDDTMREWKEIELADGKKGWIETRLIERI